MDFFKYRNIAEEGGAGDEGTPSLVAKYKSATPGQTSPAPSRQPARKGDKLNAKMDYSSKIKQDDIEVKNTMEAFEDPEAQKSEMAMTKLHFIKYAAEEIMEYINMNAPIEEWYQIKLAKVHADMEGLHSYMEGEKRRTGMVGEAASPMIAPPKTGKEFGTKADAFAYVKKHGGKVMKKSYINPRTGQKFVSYIIKEDTIDEAKMYHTSPTTILSVKDKPMWFSHNEKQAKGWHANTKDNHGKAYTYKFDVKGKIADYKDPKVKKLFNDAGINQMDYENDLVSNPSASEVLKHKGTKLLQKNGYVGYTHSDYDSTDFGKDHDSTLIFTPRKNAKMYGSLNESTDIGEAMKPYVSGTAPRSGEKGSYDVMDKNGKVVKSYPYTKGGMQMAQSYVKKLMGEGVMKNIKRQLTARDADSRAGEEAGKMMKAQQAGDTAAASKYNKRFKKLSALTKKEGYASDAQRKAVWASKNEKGIKEKLDPSMGADAYIKDFMKSDAPQFKGKSKKERQQMALAAYYAAKRGD